MTEIVTNMDSSETGIDTLLRRSLAAPVPSLSPDFHQRLTRELHASSSEPRLTVLDRYRWILLTTYSLISVVTSAVVMRGQGVGWGTIAAMTLGPLVLLAAAHSAWQSTHNAMRPGAR